MSWLIYLVGYAHLIAAPAIWVISTSQVSGLTAAVVWGFGVVAIGISAILDALKDRQP